ncbi:MAG TPA: cobalamin-binding protein [Gemmatimonadaceae bacterium]
MRIVSLLPSATEIICQLGLENQLVGVTHECDFPASVLKLPKVTRTLIPTDASSAEIDRLVRERMSGMNALYSLDTAALEQLRSDIIVTQALCDVCAVAEDEVRDAACMLPNLPPVVNLEPETLDEVLACFQQVADAVGEPRRAAPVVKRLRSRIDAVVKPRAESREPRAQGREPKAESPKLRAPRVALLEWLDPPFSTGHWNPELIRLAGGVDGLGTEGAKSRTLKWSEVVAYQPDVVLISCCGFTMERSMQDVPLLDAVPGWSDVPAVRDGRVYVTDGAAYFSRPGPRLVDSLELLAHVIHPDVHPLPEHVMTPVQLPQRSAALAR